MTRCPDPELPGGLCRYSDRCHASRQLTQVFWKMHGPDCWAWEAFQKSDAYPDRPPDIAERPISP